MKKRSSFALLALFVTVAAWACTSAIISGRLTANGRPILWKHRDSDAGKGNFLEKIEREGQIPYIALFNASDTLRREAWTGMNEKGFAIMNTVAYNLKPNSPKWIDREGFVMAQALGRCVTVDDFQALLDSLPKPMGVQTCFGVIDSKGGAAYFETDDTHYVRFDLDSVPEGYLIRSNYAYSGEPDKGMGYIRHDNARVLIDSIGRNIKPEDMINRLSSDFYHSVYGCNPLYGNERWAIDQDFIPRHSSTASIVITVPVAPADTTGCTMLAALGYPPCASAYAVDFSYIPPAVKAGSNGTSIASRRADKFMEEVFPIRRGSGQRYIDLDVLRRLNNIKK